MSRKIQSRKKNREKGLQVIRSQVAGIDLGSREHWVCCPGEGEERQVRVFQTTTSHLEGLADWLGKESIESVAMEATGVYWIPLYELLESRGFEVVLVNARQLSHVPGRKTDMQDCQWLQLLHSCGLLRGSFRPGEKICQIRALQREKSNLVSDRGRVVQRMQKALDQMNVQVHRAVTDLTGMTGMSILRAIVAGERDPIQLACFRDCRCRKSESEIAEYLKGHWRQEHLFNLEMALRLYDAVEKTLIRYDETILDLLNQLQSPERADQFPPAHPKVNKERLIQRQGDQKLRTSLWRAVGVDLTLIDGISAQTAKVVFTEIGFDIHLFPTEKHFISWIRLSPKTAFSAGKPLPKKRPSTGATRISQALRMAALSLKNSPSAIGACYRRISRRKGAGTAVFATARKLAAHVYRMLRFGQDYVDEGAKAYEERYRFQRTHYLKSLAKSMGYELAPLAKTGEVSG